MTTMIVRFRVSEFERWKAVFDSVAKQREEHGIVDASVHRNVEDRDMIVTILAARSLDAAKSWATRTRSGRPWRKPASRISSRSSI